MSDPSLFADDEELHRRLCPYMAKERFRAVIKALEGSGLRQSIRCSGAATGRRFVLFLMTISELQTMPRLLASPKTDPRISMPLRSDHPGLKYRQTASGRQPYWVARQVVREPLDFPDRTVRLPQEASDEELAELCRLYTAKLVNWLAERADGKDALPHYNGTVYSLSQVFQKHSESSFHTVKQNTRESYADSLKIIEATVGARIVRNLTVLDVKRRYREWKKPKVEGGPERIKRAHYAVTTFRMILRFGFALGFDECGKLVERLGSVTFERSGAREQEMTYTQAGAFVRKALEMGRADGMPSDRARSMAIGVAAQFDLLLRQKDIIGEWMASEPNVVGAIYDGHGEMWLGRFRWDSVPGWKLRLKTSKTRSAIEFDLQNYSLLFPLLESVPLHERIGPIVKCEAWPTDARAKLQEVVPPDRTCCRHPGRGLVYGQSRWRRY
jgi:hypothetical protein